MKGHEEYGNYYCQKRFGHLVNFGFDDKRCTCQKGQIKANVARKRVRWFFKVDCAVHGRFL